MSTDQTPQGDTQDAEPRRIIIEDLMAATGLGPKQVRHEVRAGLLPGRMRGTTYVCSPGEYDRWYQGDWTPRPAAPTNPEPQTKESTPMVRRVVFKDPSETG